MQFLAATISTFESNKRLAERAIAQVSDPLLHQRLDENTNSIVVIMKHVAGNLRSRWTDFLETDGEKPWRKRDGEFIDDFQSRDELMQYWQSGWECLFQTLQSLDADDLEKTVEIRGEPHSVSLAIQRSLGHTCYHVGQIIQLARHWVKDDWETLTIPVGQSEAFNKKYWGRRP